jgi:hypothetical protein
MVLEETPQSLSTTPSAAGLAQSWASMSDDDDVEPVEEKREEPTVPPASLSTLTLTTAVPHEGDYTPSYVGKLKLLDVGLDPRMDTALMVTLHVDEAMPSPPQVDRSRFALSRDGKR